MTAQLVSEFDTWRPGYGSATVRVYVAGTTTLASLFTDEALTVAADNPQVLDERIIDGIIYGKFLHSLYTSSAYELDIDSTDQTGVQRPPLTTLTGEEISSSVVVATGATEPHTLADTVARTVYAMDFGTLSSSGGSAASNTITLAAAIGAAAANGGGEVVIPPGTYPFNQITLSAGIVLRGYGRGVSIIQSQVQGIAVTVSGDRAGLRMITLDGVSNQTNSVGFYSKANDETVFDDAEVKRFVTGIHFKGGRRATWRDFYINSCGTGAKLHGDSDPGNGADGDEFRNNSWSRGLVSLCTVKGIELSWEDKLCINNKFRDVGFEDSTGAATVINGARYTEFDGCWWKANTITMQIHDDDITTTAARNENTVIGLFIGHGEINGGSVTFKDTCQDAVLEGLNILGVAFTLSTPLNNPVAVRDCIEDGAVTLAGEGSKYHRFNRINEGQSSGITTDATPTKAWSIAMVPGQMVYLEAKVIGRQRNAAAYAAYHRIVRAVRPGGTLNYDTQTVNFAAGLVVTGTTSHATARIQADSDSGTTGALTLVDVNGVFIDNELITDTGGGSATVNGAMTFSDAALKGSVETLGTIYEDDSAWEATFVANGPEIELRVTGAASKTVEWEVNVIVVSN